MLQTSETLLTDDSSEQILCFYINASTEIRIIRLENSKNCNLDRIAFPGEKILFIGEPKAQLAIYTGSNGKAILSHLIPCASLQVEK
ncbi:MAG: DUF1830 domain-containing protein [Phormidium sp.]